MKIDETDELWTRLLAGEALTAEEQQRLLAAMSADPVRRTAMLQERELDGLLRASVAEDDADAFASEWRARWKAEQEREAFVATVERRVRAEVPARRRRWLAGGVGLGVIALAAVLALVFRPPGGPNLADDTHVTDETVVKAQVVPRVDGLRGVAQRVSAGRRTPLRVGDRLNPGDGVITGPGVGAVALQLADGSRLRMVSDSLIPSVTTNAEDGTTSVVLSSGVLMADVAGRALRVATPHARAEVVGAAFTVEARPRSTRIGVTRGSVRVLAGERTVRVAAGHQVITGEAQSLTLTRAPAGVATLLVGDAAAEGDQSIKRRLEAMGFDVRTRDVAATVPADLEGSAVVLVSASIRATPRALPPIMSELRTLPVPLVTWEPRLYAALGMTLAGAEEMGIAPSTVQIVINDPMHPLSAGLTGTVELFAHGPEPLRWAAPGPLAAWAATLPGEPTKAICFGYERGIPMPGGPAPARRVGLGLKVASALHLSEAGWAVFEAAVTWAADRYRHPP